MFVVALEPLQRGLGPAALVVLRLSQRLLQHLLVVEVQLAVEVGVVDLVDERADLVGQLEDVLAFLFFPLVFSHDILQRRHRVDADELLEAAQHKVDHLVVVRLLGDVILHLLEAPEDDRQQHLHERATQKWSKWIARK